MTGFGSFGPLTGPQTGDVLAIIARFWKLIVVVTVVVFLVVSWSGTRTPSAYRSTARVEVVSTNEDGETETVRGAAIIDLFRSDAVHQQALAASGLEPSGVEWRASQEEDVETLRLEVVTGDPALSLAYALDWLSAVEGSVASQQDTTGFLGEVDSRLATLTQEKEELAARLTAARDQARSSGDVEDQLAADLLALEVSGTLGSLQTEINEHTDVQARLNRNGTVQTLRLDVLQLPRQAAWGPSKVQVARNAVFGGFLGLAMGMGSAFLAAALRPRLYDRADLDRLGVAVIGPIPVNRLPSAEPGPVAPMAERPERLDIVVGTYGVDAEEIENERLSARVAAQIRGDDQAQSKAAGLVIQPIGELTQSDGMTLSGQARGTVVAVPAGVAESGDLRRLLTAIRLTGGSLMSVVLIERERPDLFVHLAAAGRKLSGRAG